VLCRQDISVSAKSQSQRKRPACGGASARRCYLQGSNLTLSLIVRNVNAKETQMRSSANQHRTACYIDGFNLYYGLKDIGRREWYWLDVRAMACKLLARAQILSATK
jgi:hypothetical protein